MDFHLRLRSKDNYDKFVFYRKAGGLKDLDAARAAVGVDFPAKCLDNLIDKFEGNATLEISEAEARAFGGFEETTHREIIIDGFVEKYRKVKYDIKREEETDAIIRVAHTFDFDFHALLEDWKAAGCPDTLTIPKD